MDPDDSHPIAASLPSGGLVRDWAAGPGGHSGVIGQDAAQPGGSSSSTAEDEVRTRRSNSTGSGTAASGGAAAPVGAAAGLWAFDDDDYADDDIDDDSTGDAGRLLLAGQRHRGRNRHLRHDGSTSSRRSRRSDRGSLDGAEADTHPSIVVDGDDGSPGHARHGDGLGEQGDAVAQLLLPDGDTAVTYTIDDFDAFGGRRRTRTTVGASTSNMPAGLGPADDQSSIGYSSPDVENAHIWLLDADLNQSLELHPRTDTQRHYYMLIHGRTFALIDFLFAMVFCLLVIFETPALFSMPRPLSITIELLCVLWQLAIIFPIKRRFGSWVTYFSSHGGGHVHALLAVIMAFEWIFSVSVTKHRRWLRLLRPLFVLRTDYAAGVRRVLRQIMLAVPPVIDMMALLMFFVTIFSVLALYLFGHIEYNTDFQTLNESFTSMFILMTTSNYPDVMMASYNNTRWAALFFIFYLIVTLFFLQNLILAVVYQRFSDEEKNKFHKIFIKRRKALRRVYHCLADVETGGIHFGTFAQLMNVYQPKMTLKTAFICFKALNSSQSGAITMTELMQFYQITELEWWLDEGNVLNPNELVAWRRPLRKIVAHPVYEYIVLIVVASNCAYLLFVANRENDSIASGTLDFSLVQGMFLIFYSIEVTFKMTTLTPTRYFKDPWNTFDFVITVTSVLGQILEELLPRASVFILFRPFRLLRLLKTRKVFRDILYTTLAVMPRMARFGCVMLAVYYVFSILGMEWFNDSVINCNKECGAEYILDPPDQQGYYQINNFDDVARSYVTLFELTVVNNWLNTMGGHVIMVGKQARAFFMIFYLIVVLVFMNVVVAYIIDSFQKAFPILQRRHERLIAGLPPDFECEVNVHRSEVITYFPPDVAEEFLSSASRQNYEFQGLRPLTHFALLRAMFEDDMKLWVQEEVLEYNKDLAEAYERRSIGRRLSASVAMDRASAARDRALSSRRARAHSAYIPTQDSATKHA